LCSRTLDLTKANLCTDTVSTSASEKGRTDNRRRKNKKKGRESERGRAKERGERSRMKEGEKNEKKWGSSLQFIYVFIIFPQLIFVQKNIGKSQKTGGKCSWNSLQKKDSIH
jgi:hypothetical protein